LGNLLKEWRHATLEIPRPDPYRDLFTTLDRSNPTASAVAIKDGKFAAVGHDNDVMVLAGPQTRVRVNQDITLAGLNVAVSPYSTAWLENISSSVTVFAPPKRPRR
jgi:hypothetical protein